MVDLSVKTDSYDMRRQEIEQVAKSPVLESENPIGDAFMDFRRRAGVTQAYSAKLFCGGNVKRLRQYEKNLKLPEIELARLILRLTFVETSELVQWIQEARSSADACRQERCEP